LLPKSIYMKTTFIEMTKTGFVVTCFLFVVAGCKKNPFPKPDQLNANYEQVNLVGDNDQYNPMRVDPDLRNAWGQAFAPSGPDWVNAQATGFSFIFNTQGGDVRPPVAIPSPTSDMGGGHPTGIVFNGSSGFRLPNGNPARFIFVGDDGVISGWNGGNVAIRVKDHSSRASYTGLAIAADGADSFIYAANFLSGHIEVYDTAWGDVSGKPFADPSLPQDYAPFNIQNVDGNDFAEHEPCLKGSPAVVLQLLDVDDLALEVDRTLGNARWADEAGRNRAEAARPERSSHVRSTAPSSCSRRRASARTRSRRSPRRSWISRQIASSWRWRRGGCVT